MEGMEVNRKMLVILHQVFPEQTNSVVTENYIADYPPHSWGFLFVRVGLVITTGYIGGQLY